MQFKGTSQKNSKKEHFYEKKSYKLGNQFVNVRAKKKKKCTGNYNIFIFNGFVTNFSITNIWYRERKKKINRNKTKTAANHNN